MQRSRIPDWLAAVFPALVWLLFRYAAKSLPPVLADVFGWVIPAAAVLWYCLRRKASVFCLSFCEILLWTGVGITCGFLDRICFGKPAGPDPSVSSFLLLCILGPAAEEAVYRGFVYERCLCFLPAAGALVLNSLLFAVGHGTPAAMAVAFIAGILFSLARKKSGTVVAPVICHIMVNTIVFLL
jgi:membrane protease YdiL (CAAX protease family)